MCKVFARQTHDWLTTIRWGGLMGNLSKIAGKLCTCTLYGK